MNRLFLGHVFVGPDRITVLGLQPSVRSPEGRNEVRQTSVTMGNPTGVGSSPLARNPYRRPPILRRSSWQVGLSRGPQMGVGSTESPLSRKREGIPRFRSPEETCLGFYVLSLVRSCKRCSEEKSPVD